jgi:hypothetical protein
MSFKRSFCLFTLLGWACAMPAVAQLDTYSLRAKYGAPLNRETFRMPAGFDLIVDYGSASQVCKIEVPALMPTTENVSNADQMKRRMYDFLADLVPASMRGKELRRMVNVSGMISLSSVEYERVTVHELQYADQPFSSNNAITVTFQNCETRPLQ